MPGSPNLSRKLNSAQVLGRFGVRVVLLVTFAALSSAGFARSFAALTWMAVILCALVGLIRRESPFCASLNHWDEAVAFGALFALARIAGDLA